MLHIICSYSKILRVPDLKEACIERCEETLLKCILDCDNDVDCYRQCNRFETECRDSKSNTSIFMKNLSL